jgi:hypothetical protein
VRQSGSSAGVTYKLVLLARDIGNIHVVGGWAKFFKLLASEDINGDEMDLGVAVLSGLRGRHVDDLARAVLDDNEAVLPQSRALHGISSGSASIGRIEGVLMLRFAVSNGCLDTVEFGGLETNAPNRQNCMVGRVRGVAGKAHLGIVVLRHLV